MNNALVETEKRMKGAVEAFQGAADVNAWLNSWGTKDRKSRPKL